MQEKGFGVCEKSFNGVTDHVELRGPIDETSKQKQPKGSIALECVRSCFYVLSVLSFSIMIISLNEAVVTNINKLPLDKFLSIFLASGYFRYEITFQFGAAVLFAVMTVCVSYIHRRLYVKKARMGLGAKWITGFWIFAFVVKLFQDIVF